MELRLNKTGQERKDLVYAIGEIIGVAPVYTGAGGIHGMRFAYTVMNIIIDQNGTVIWDERTDETTVEKLFDGLQAKGYEIDRPTAEKPKRKGILDTLVDALNENTEDGAKWERLHHEPTIIDGSGREHSLDGRFTAAGIPDDWENGMTEEDELGLGRTRREDFQGENGMRADDVPEPDTLTVEYPLDGFTPETIENLTKMVTAKESLIKAALGADELPIQQSDDDGGKLLFPWFTLEEPSQAAYYVQFIWALCKTAKEKKRVTAKERGLIGNPKYAMRCWLLSLGLIGDEYKAARKLLLSRLTGNSSWKNGKPEETQDEATE